MEKSIIGDTGFDNMCETCGAMWNTDGDEEVCPQCGSHETINI